MGVFSPAKIMRNRVDRVDKLTKVDGFWLTQVDNTPDGVHREKYQI